jgi:hypothetical protein
VDPNVAYGLFLAALKDGRVGEAADAADNLSDWLLRGGFIPAGLKAHGGLSGKAYGEMFSTVSLVLMWARSDLDDD